MGGVSVEKSEWVASGVVGRGEREREQERNRDGECIWTESG